MAKLYQRDSRPKTQSLEAECQACGASFEKATRRYYKYETRDSQGRPVTHWKTSCVECGRKAFAVEDVEYGRPTINPKTYKPTKQVGPQTKVIEGVPGRRPASLSDDLVKQKMYKMLRTCGGVEKNWKEEDLDRMVDAWFDGLDDINRESFVERFFKWLEDVVKAFAEDIDTLEDIWSQEELQWFHADLQTLELDAALGQAYDIVDTVEDHTDWTKRRVR